MSSVLWFGTYPQRRVNSFLKLRTVQPLNLAVSSMPYRASTLRACPRHCIGHTQYTQASARWFSFAGRTYTCSAVQYNSPSLVLKQPCATFSNRLVPQSSLQHPYQTLHPSSRPSDFLSNPPSRTLSLHHTSKDGSCYQSSQNHSHCNQAIVTK
jgi:hypothetical protein